MAPRPGPALSADEFAQFQRLLHELAGIWIAPAKKVMVEGRLLRRLQHHELGSFSAYYRLLVEDASERQTAIDLLTTNETHFFREPKHFDFLKHQAARLCAPGRPLRVWSAACSTGQEPYTIAMVLSQALPDTPWEVFASDLSVRVLERARTARYDMQLTSEIPREYLQACCLKGVAEEEGYFTIAPELSRRVSFARINLNEPLPSMEGFDVIFLRNVLIYFQPDIKRTVLTRLLQTLRPGGYLLVGHAESLHGHTAGLTMTAPAIYRKQP
ncbi:MAG TPA: protein-glutamate O-methyltransferase CheR [Steroidobacteraceae bacterium]|nr:protein-glutamate O-methyltransferase CheR [Steroidobacteraceae bacterium]